MAYKYKLLSETKVSKNKTDIKDPDFFKRGKIDIRDNIPKEFCYLTDEDLTKLNNGEKVYVTIVTTNVLEVEQ